MKEEVKMSVVMDKVPIVEKVKRKEEVGEGRWKGKIVITMCDGEVPKVEFAGRLTGEDVALAWRVMMKEYRKWKFEEMKRLEKERGRR